MVALGVVPLSVLDGLALLLELAPLEVPEGLVLAPLGSVVLGAVLVPLGEVLEPVDALSETMANSSRPEAALMISSLIVPSLSPELLLISAPLSWLAFSSWCPIRPVALKCRPTQPDSLDCSAADPCEGLDGPLELLDELSDDCACAPSARPAAHNAIIGNNPFLIICLSLLRSVGQKRRLE